MKNILILILFTVFSAAHAAEQIERYGVLPTIQKMTVSPNGKQVAYRAVTLEQDIISVIDIEQGENLANVDISSIKPRAISYINDDNLLLTVSGRAKIPGFKGIIDLTTASTYNIKSKEYNQLLVPGKGKIYAGQSSLHKIVGISPNGKSVYMPAYSGEPSFVGGRQVMPPMSLFKINLNGSGRPRIHKTSKGQVTDYFVNDEGDVIAIEVFDDESNTHSIFAYKGKKSEEIFAENTPYRTKNFIGVSLDQQHLFMLDEDTTNNRWSIYTLSLKNGEIVGPLYDKSDADITGHFTNTQRQVFGIRYSGFNPSYTFFDKDLDARVKAILAEYSGHSVTIEEISPNRQHVLVKVEGNQYAGEYYLYSKGKKTVFVTTSRPQIPVDDIHPMISLTFAARDGLKIPTLVTIPRSRAASLNNLPAIILPHGGPESYNAIGFDYMAQAFAQQGYLVIQPQFRGSYGFGIKHQAAGYGEWGRKALHDLTDAVDFFAGQNLIDRNRLCIVGASYGGYTALAGGAFEPDLYKCVVSINGIGNLEDMLDRTRNESGASSSALAFWEAQIFGFGEKDQSIAQQRSPENSTSTFKAPVLLIYSSKDQVVHPRQSVTMYRALKEAGKSVEQVELIDEDHYLSHGKTRLEALKATINFVNKHI